MTVLRNTTLIGQEGSLYQGVAGRKGWAEGPTVVPLSTRKVSWELLRYRGGVSPQGALPSSISPRLGVTIHPQAEHRFPVAQERPLT